MAEAAEETIKSIEFGGWNLLKTEGKVPTTRYSSASTLFESNLYLFGGASSGEDDTSTYRGDLLTLNLEKEPLEWKSVEQAGSVPSAREGASFNCVGDKLYLFGGVDKESSSTCAEGLFAFTAATGTWERLTTIGSSPKTQSSTSIVYENKLITFGGILNGKAQNCVHFLDFNTLEWTEMAPSGTLPPPRCDHVASMVGGRMFVTSGSGSDDLWFNDLYALEFASSHWSKIELKGDITFTARDYATVNCLANTYLILFGGFSGINGEEQCFADLHYMDLSTDEFQWQAVSTSGGITPPSRYAHSSIIYQNKLFVFSGQSMDQEFNDIWETSIKNPLVDFEPTPKPRVHYSTSTPIPAPRKVITPAPPKAPKPRDLEELRGTYIKKINEMLDTLVERFQQLDVGNGTLESEKAAFDAEKKAHFELYERQQQELDEMLKNHREQNDMWVSRIRKELDNERRELALERAAAEQVSMNLAKEQEAFQQKSKKLDAIMRQVQGLKD